MDKTVTTKELADTLGVSIETIRQTARKIITPSNSTWKVINGGKSQVFNEAQATAIKIELQNHSKIAQNGFNELPFDRLPAQQESTMTVKEAAGVLGVSERTIQRHLKEIRELSKPDNVVEVQNGVKSLMTEKEVTLIKKKIELSGRSDIINPVALPKTYLEKQLLIRQAMQLQNEMIAELEAENQQLKIENAVSKPKAEYYDTLVERGASTNIRNTAKELKIPERKFIKLLELDGYLYRDSKNQLCPYSEYVQKGFFEVKEWAHGEKTGVQTLVTVKGKRFLIGKYPAA